jgi:hypothetical protein
MWIVILGVAVATTTVGQTGLTVPSSLLVAASRSPVEFIKALAYASIPSGLEIRESDDVMPSPLPRAFDIDRERVSLDGLIATFNAAHPDYHAVVMRGGVTVVRPIRGTLPFLDQPSSLSNVVTVTGALAAARLVFTPVDSRLAGPILNSLGHEGEDVPVLLDGGGGRTVVDTLNRIVTQAPGRSWVVTTREERDGGVRVIGFGFVDADGRRLTQPMRGPAGSRPPLPVSPFTR